MPPSRRFGDRYSAQQQSRAAVGTRRVYTYEDENGRLLYQKVRTPTKQFFYRHPTSDGSWSWGLGGARLVLYGLPLLREIDWTFVPEGEKDVETLWGIGLPATTNPEGASKWRDAYSIQLRSAGVRRVFIIPDNDKVGRLHARQVRRSCKAHGIQAHLVTLPGVPLKGDVSDYIGQGHTRRDLLRLALAAGESK